MVPSRVRGLARAAWEEGEVVLSGLQGKGGKEVGVCWWLASGNGLDGVSDGSGFHNGCTTRRGCK